MTASTRATGADHIGCDRRLFGAAPFSFGANLAMIVPAIIAILMTAPKGGPHEEGRK